MQDYRVANLLVGEVLVLTTLAGLVRRRRWQRLRLLPVHLVATALVETGALIEPERFRVWRVWVVRESFWLAVTFGIVAEVAWRAFAHLPAERRHVRLVLALALLIPFGLVALTPWHHAQLATATWLYVYVAEILPRLTYGTGFVCLALVWAMAKKLVPSDPLHASVLLGLAAYLFVYSVSLGRMGQGGPAVLAYVVTPVAYTVLVAFWAWVAWRDERTPDAPVHVRRKLQPWRN